MYEAWGWFLERRLSKQRERECVCVYVAGHRTGPRARWLTCKRGRCLSFGICLSPFATIESVLRRLAPCTWRLSADTMHTIVRCTFQFGSNRLLTPFLGPITFASDRLALHKLIAQPHFTVLSRPRGAAAPCFDCIHLHVKMVDRLCRRPGAVLLAYLYHFRLHDGPTFEKCGKPPDHPLALLLCSTPSAGMEHSTVHVRHTFWCNPVQHTNRWLSRGSICCKHSWGFHTNVR